MSNIDHTDTDDTDELFRQAIACFHNEDLHTSEILVRKILDEESRHAGANHLMGLIEFRRGHHDLATRMISQAIEHSPHEPAYYHDLGTVFMAQGEHQKALACYQKTLSISPGYIEAIYNIGNIYATMGMHEKALSCYTKAIAEKPDYAEAYYSMGVVQQTLGRLHPAIDSYKRALSIRADLVEAYNNLGTCFEAAGNHEEAISCYKYALSINPDHAKTHNNMGVAFQARGNPSKALECYIKAVSLEPGYAIAHCNMGVILNKLGRPDEAIASYRRALSVNPSLITARWGELLTLPQYYDSIEDVHRARNNWVSGVTKLLNTIDLSTAAGVAEAKRAASIHTGFYLNYQGMNDLDIQMRYGQLLTRIACAAYPEYAHITKQKISCTQRKIRIGFVSGFFYSHSVFKSHGHWITKLDTRDFEISVFYVGMQKDQATEAISNSADYFFDIRDTDELIQAIVKQDLDILIYLDIGMEPRIQLPPALRLVPVQCTTWGHPVSSGLPTIDYYLSSDLMEPADGDSHYVEKLVRLPNLGVSYPCPDTDKMVVPESTKRDSNNTVYLNLQNLIKLLPQHDDLYPIIAKEVPASKFWFLCGMEAIAAQFRKRLTIAFAKHSLDADDYCVIHPKLNQAEFFGLTKSADVILDSISWSGCNSTLEALALDKPVVTVPGPMMRSRHSYAILRRINVTDTIANDTDEYIKIAGKLGLDVSFREEISNRIASHKHLAFNDREVISALEEFLRSSINHTCIS